MGGPFPVAETARRAGGARVDALRHPPSKRNMGAMMAMETNY